MKLARRLLFLGIVVGVAVTVWRKLAAPADSSLSWESQPVPFPPAPRPNPVTLPTGVDAEGGPELDGVLAGIEPWISADGGVCPPSHPVKAKLSSGIFHVPGGTNYARTRADRCYLDASAAEADGLRQSKR